MVDRQRYAYEPDYAVHPGEYLEEVLESRGIKKKDLSERLGISVKHLSQIINKQAGISADLAIKLESTLRISANIWNKLNADYQLMEARRREKHELEKQVNWVRQFPTKELARLNLIPANTDPKGVLDSMLRFFAIATPERWGSYYTKLAKVHFRKSRAFSDNLPHIAAWLRAGEILAQDFEMAPFSREIFKKSLIAIRSLTAKKPSEFEPRMKRLCAEAGVALVFVPEFEGTHISGATRWLTQDKALIILSLRYKTNDHFWFTFFHEAGHLLLHGKKEIFIDGVNGSNSSEEDKADRFARNALVPEENYKRFVSEGRFFKIDIKSFAGSVNVHPGIVVGRLQHDGKIEYDTCNDLKERFELRLQASSKG